MKHKKWFLLIILVAIIGTAIFGLNSTNHASQSKKDAHKTNTYIVKAAKSKLYRAEYVSAEYTSLTKIPKEKLLVNDGDHVIKGQKISTSWTTAPISGVFSNDKASEDRIYNSPGLIQFKVSENERSNFSQNKSVTIESLTDQRSKFQGTIKSISARPVAGGVTALSEYKVTVTPDDPNMTNSMFFGKHFSIKVGDDDLAIPTKYVTKSNQVNEKRSGSGWTKANLKVDSISNGYCYVSKSSIPVGTELKQP